MCRERRGQLALDMHPDWWPIHFSFQCGENIYRRPHEWVGICRRAKHNTWVMQLIQRCGVNKHVFPGSGGLWSMVSWSFARKWLTMWKCKGGPVHLAHSGGLPPSYPPTSKTHNSVSQQVCNYLIEKQISALRKWSLSLAEGSAACQLAYKVLTSSGIQTLWSRCADGSDNHQFDICGSEWSRLNNWGCQHASVTKENHLENLTKQQAHRSFTFPQSHSALLPKLEPLWLRLRENRDQCNAKPTPPVLRQ